MESQPQNPEFRIKPEKKITYAVCKELTELSSTENCKQFKYFTPP